MALYGLFEKVGDRKYKRLRPSIALPRESAIRNFQSELMAHTSYSLRKVPDNQPSPDPIPLCPSCSRHEHDGHEPQFTDSNGHLVFCECGCNVIPR